MYWDISAYFSTALVDAAIIPVIADDTVFGRASALYEKLEKKKKENICYGPKDYVSKYFTEEHTP